MDENARSLLSSMHRDSAAFPLDGADDYGVFREPFLAPLFQDAIPVVIDANVIRNEIVRTHRAGRTVLINGASTRAFRLFVAQHVLDEVERYCERWALETKIAVETYRRIWYELYRPLLRLVSTIGLFELLLPEEQKRIQTIGRIDPDDVPSATLALALAIGALFVSEDQRVYAIVQGANKYAADATAWLTRLQDGGDAAKLYEMQSLSAAAAITGVYSMWNAARWVHAKSPAAAFGLGIAAVVGMAFVSEDVYASALKSAGRGASRFATTITIPQVAAANRVRLALPEFPLWSDLTSDISKDAALARACLFRLSRSRKAPMRLAELSDDLPLLAICRTASRVGKIVRANLCFVEPLDGKWQVGTAIVNAKSDA